MRGAVAFIGRAVLIGLVFGVARTAATIAVGGPAGGDIVSLFAIEAAAGGIVGVWLAFIVTYLAGSGARVAAALGTLVLVNLVAVMIEGAAYEPAAQPVAGLPMGVLLQLIVAALVGLATVGLVPGRRASGAVQRLPRRSVMSWLGRYVTCVLVYVLLYFVVGAINFTLVTGPYYTSGTAGLVVPPPAVVLTVAAIEGTLFPIALLPLVYALPGSRLRRALIGGTSLFILGGVVPLIVAPSLPLLLRVSSGVEILFQKLPAGAAAAALLGPETDASARLAGDQPDRRRHVLSAWGQRNGPGRKAAR